MLEITTHNLPLIKRKEVWFYKGGSIKKEAYTVFSAANKPYSGKCEFLEKYQTVVIDLLKKETELLNAIHPTYRYDIRSAQKKGIISKMFLRPNLTDCLELINSYNAFAAEKKIPEMNKRWVKALQKNGSIIFSKAFFRNEDITTHVYIFDKETISLFSSFHNVNFSDSKIRSEANKLLHWEDILYSKNSGFKKYDWGGINPIKLPGVSKFKMSFGGDITENYRFIKTNPVLYYIINMLKKING